MWFIKLDRCRHTTTTISATACGTDACDHNLPRGNPSFGGRILRFSGDDDDNDDREHRYPPGRDNTFATYYVMYVLNNIFYTVNMS